MKQKEKEKAKKNEQENVEKKGIRREKEAVERVRDSTCIRS